MKHLLSDDPIAPMSLGAATSNRLADNRVPTAILGSGIIGTDLLYKIQRSEHMKCACFVGRRDTSEGIIKAREMGVHVSTGEAPYLYENPDLYEIIFDATNVEAHYEHCKVFDSLGKMIFDLTPSHSGIPIVPTINSDKLFASRNISLVSCGGQASLPVLHAISKECDHVEYVEMVNTSASKSVGLGTRLYMDEYLETTEATIREFTECENVKCIAGINPAVPPVHMRVTITVLAKYSNKERIEEAVKGITEKVKQYVPGYNMISPPIFGKDKITVLLRISGRGDYLEEYAGNLDIINAAAVYLGDLYSKEFLRDKPFPTIHGEKK